MIFHGSKLMQVMINLQGFISSATEETTFEGLGGKLSSTYTNGRCFLVGLPGKAVKEKAWEANEAVPYTNRRCFLVGLPGKAVKENEFQYCLVIKSARTFYFLPP